MTKEASESVMEGMQNKGVTMDLLILLQMCLKLGPVGDGVPHTDY